VGIGGRKGSRNSPTVFNAVLSFRQFWDGRAGSLHQQASGPIENGDEMSGDWANILFTLATDADLIAHFERAYPLRGLGKMTVVDAIATFEASLLTPDAPFDKFLLGDTTALSVQQKRGLDRFVDLGCSSCHQGRAVGGNMYQTFGLMVPRPMDDLGRFDVTGDKADLHMFKVPSLRNVELTAPYLHDGSVASLRRTIRIMARHQLGRQLSTDEVDDLEAFLLALTAPQPKLLASGGVSP